MLQRRAFTRPAIAHVGLASALNELAGEAGVAIELDETRLPLRPEVSGMCELLGLDPLYLANEGRVVIFSRLNRPRHWSLPCADAGRRRGLRDRQGQARVLRPCLPPHSFGGARLVDMLTESSYHAFAERIWTRLTGTCFCILGGTVRGICFTDYDSCADTKGRQSCLRPERAAGVKRLPVVRDRR